MEISVKLIGDIAVVRPIGKLTLGSGDVQLRNTIREILDRGQSKVLLVLSGLSAVDSVGLQELVGAFTKIYTAGGRLVVAELPPKIQDILEVTQLITVFEVADSLGDGLELLRS